MALDHEPADGHVIRLRSVKRRESPDAAQTPTSDGSAGIPWAGQRPSPLDPRSSAPRRAAAQLRLGSLGVAGSRHGNPKGRSPGGGSHEGLGHDHLVESVRHGPIKGRDGVQVDLHLRAVAREGNGRPHAAAHAVDGREETPAAVQAEAHGEVGLVEGAAYHGALAHVTRHVVRPAGESLLGLPCGQRERLVRRVRSGGDAEADRAACAPADDLYLPVGAVLEEVCAGHGRAGARDVPPVAHGDAAARDGEPARVRAARACAAGREAGLLGALAAKAPPAALLEDAQHGFRASQVRRGRPRGRR
eukprot:CAMPEP_0206027816 /NCGR_PEP_ID=MMETSP1464-20131121/43876_1 /ASSEMBLY_ACC=CAM_ASM_001124 /TAXON_ID=119497 /ORGANISM="Exanthemachrysis gayraliae, Strain RCC1523" /LENGTH=303 /DNA_ID=CAMNT_0053401861 /DNA_START=139 /DNA_END=1047 /DNA_ORIENTATION=-